MSNDIKELLSIHDSVEFATGAGTDMHVRLGRVRIDCDMTYGDVELISKIKMIPGLEALFSSASQCEVPIAGHINGLFISRRIDRLYIDENTKMVYVLDYKTDANHDTFHDKYVAQLREYVTLLRQIYPKHKIVPLILWTHDWVLEKL